MSFWRRTRRARDDSSPFSRVRELDQWVPANYPPTPDAELGDTHALVRQLVDELAPNGIDAGTGAALDHLIDSWASRRLAMVITNHTERETVADHLIGAAAEEYAQRSLIHDAAQRELARLTEALDATHARLVGVQSVPTKRSGAAPDKAAPNEED